MSSARDQKHQQAKIYNEDQLQNAWDKSDQRIKEMEDEFYRKTSKKKLLGTQDDSVTTMMCQLLKQQSEWNGIPTTQWNSTILRQSSTKLSRRE